jgi:aryl-alcohol dehydrogenase-like predicted oxidoreductase
MPSYRSIGNSGLRTFPIALGTMQFGWTTDQANSEAVMDAFVEAGGNLIDTADIYTIWTKGNPGGVSEEIIGRWMRARGNRDRIVLATKVRGAMGEGGSEGFDHPLQREGLSRRWILKACEDSLRRLQTDHIDLYQVHWIDSHTPIEETLSALTDLVRRGYVRYLGCSNFSAWRLMQALWASDRLGLESFISVQPEYNITQPTRANFERELLPVCEAYGVGILPYSPLGGGFLTGKYRRGQELPDSARAQEIQRRLFNDTNWTILDAVLQVANAHQASPAQVALAWLLSRPQMAAPIIGANTAAQLADLLPAADLALEAAEVEQLDQASSWARSRTELER